MNRRYMSTMILDDHCAAEREWATAHRSVAEFENIIRSGRGIPDRLHRNVKRIHKELAGIRTGMYEVLNRTLPDASTESCWVSMPAMDLVTSTGQHPTRVLTVGDHVAAARALGPSQPAINRFLEIISNRRHLPVRLLDCGIHIEHLIQIIRCEMEDVQFYTLRGRGIPWVNCWLGWVNHFEGTEREASASTTNDGADSNDRIEEAQ